MRSWFQVYGKVIPLFLGSIFLVVQSAVSDDVVTGDEKIQIALIVVGGIVTYIVPNLVGGIAHFAKGITSAAIAVLTGLSGWLVDGMSTSDWWNLLIAAATAAGVLVLPSVKHPE